MVAKAAEALPTRRTCVPYVRERCAAPTNPATCFSILLVTQNGQRFLSENSKRTQQAYTQGEDHRRRQAGDED
jgi:hypothetical protein